MAVPIWGRSGRPSRHALRLDFVSRWALVENRSELPTAARLLLRQGQAVWVAGTAQTWSQLLQETVPVWPTGGADGAVLEGVARARKLSPRDSPESQTGFPSMPRLVPSRAGFSDWPLLPASNRLHSETCQQESLSPLSAAFLHQRPCSGICFFDSVCPHMRKQFVGKVEVSGSP